jgi:hypothetical protein
MMNVDFPEGAVAVPSGVVVALDKRLLVGALERSPVVDAREAAPVAGAREASASRAVGCCSVARLSSVVEGLLLFAVATAAEEPALLALDSRASSPAEDACLVVSRRVGAREGPIVVSAGSS